MGVGVHEVEHAAEHMAELVVQTGRGRAERDACEVRAVQDVAQEHFDEGTLLLDDDDVLELAEVPRVLVVAHDVSGVLREKVAAGGLEAERVQRIGDARDGEAREFVALGLEADPAQELGVAEGAVGVVAGGPAEAEVLPGGGVVQQVAVLRHQSRCGWVRVVGAKGGADGRLGVGSVGSRSGFAYRDHRCRPPLREGRCAAG